MINIIRVLPIVRQSKIQSSLNVLHKWAENVLRNPREIGRDPKKGNRGDGRL